MEFIPLKDKVGIEVRDADLAALSDEDFAELRRAWVENGVMLVRGQTLDGPSLQALASRFGELTGRTTCNMAVSGTDLVQQSLYVREVLVPLYAPETILWAIRDSTRTKSAINSQYLRSTALERARWPAGEQQYRAPAKPV